MALIHSNPLFEIPDKSVVECCLKMFEDEIAVDVTFVFDRKGEQDNESQCKAPSPKKSKSDLQDTAADNQLQNENEHVYKTEDNSSVKIRAHKFMLMARSPVFREMFTTSIEATDVINISDCRDSEAFKQMLRYIYSDIVQLDSSSVMNILCLARKYSVQGLITQCLRYAKHCVTPVYVLKIIEEAFRYGENDIVQVCLTTILRETDKTLLSEYFYSISHETLSLILDEQVLSITESDLCSACIEWAKRKCVDNTSDIEPSGDKIREALGSCMYKMQLQNMNAKSFTKLIVKKDILPEPLAFKFYQYILSEDDERGEIPDRFASGRKVIMHGKLQSCGTLRKSQIVESYDLHLKIENTKLTTTKPIKIDYLAFLVLLHPSLKAELELCYLVDDQDTVVIDDKACCQSIKYVTPKDVKVNGQVVMIDLFPLVELRDVCNVTVNLRSNIQIKFLPAEVGSLSDDSVSVDVKYEGNKSLPLYYMGYSLCEA